jgi:DNA helicase-2/ATP-dependent DNA helicase PcrA
MSILDQLNERQREAVTSIEGPLLVLAGAGSGKTRVITYRIAYLIGRLGVASDEILAVTFTNKASEEMRGRASRLLGQRGGQLPWISTFHSLCVRLLRRDGPAAGLRRDFAIYAEDEQLALVRRVMKDLGLDDFALQPRNVLARISHAKNHGSSPPMMYQAGADRRSEQVAVIYERYQAALQRSNALDFDDLLLQAVRLLETSPETAAKYNQRFHHVLVDEYQDTNRAQYELIRLLTQLHRNLCVVGDEDQSIYAWRGADIRNILEFEKDFPEARTIRLEQNYRSTKNILAAAGAVVARNTARKGKTLWTENEAGPFIGLYEAPDAENEGLFIAAWLSRYLRETPEGRAAVLYRTNAQSRQLEEAMRRYGLKYHMAGGFSFYERAEIKDLLAYLKFARNPQDTLSLLRIINTPPRHIGVKTIEQVELHALEHGVALWEGIEGVLSAGILPPRAHSAVSGFRQLAEDLLALAQAGAPTTDLLRAVLGRTGYLKALEQEETPEAIGRVENIRELLNAAQDSGERGESLADFLDHAALVSEADDVDERAPINLMTLHSAKGLEFPVVFVAGMEERLFPHSRSLESTLAIEEERRLCYVGMTRAQERLILTRAEFRRYFGAEGQDFAEPSRFLAEIPAKLIENLGEAPRRRERQAYQGETCDSLENIAEFFAARGIPLPLKSSGAKVQARPSEEGIRMGQRVRHPKFGVGTVLRREGDGDDAKLTVSFPGFGLKKMVAKYAGLEKA